MHAGYGIKIGGKKSGQCCGAVGYAANCDIDIPRGVSFCVPTAPLLIQPPANVHEKTVDYGSSTWVPVTQVWDWLLASACPIAAICQVNQLMDGFLCVCVVFQINKSFYRVLMSSTDTIFCQIL